MLQRIKRLWALSGLTHIETGAIHGQFNPDGRPVYRDIVTLVKGDIGDGKAEFIGEGTEAEFIEQEQADKGNKGWLDRIKRL